MPEIRKAFHEKLDGIRHDLVLLAAKVTDVIPRGTEALLALDMASAQAIIDGDDDLDALTVDIEERCFELMARQQPMAGDLRALVTAVRLASEIERSGDLVVNIAKGARRIYGAEIPGRLRSLVAAMSVEAERLFRLAVDAYVEQDADLASALDDIDDRLDRIHADYIAAIIERDETLDLQVGVQLALIGRYYERIGDHAVNIGERVRYMVTGWLPEHTGAARAATRRAERDEVAVAPAAPSLTAFSATPQGVLLFGEEGEVSFSNEAATGFLSARHGEALVEEAIAELREAALAAGREASRTVELAGPPGRVLLLRAVPLTRAGEPAGVLAVIDDMTARRRIDEIRRDFVANISHELKTPVGALVLLAEALLAEADPATSRRLTERMLDESLRVSRSIDDLLELARIEAGEEELRQPVLVADCIAEAADRVRQAAERRGVELVVEGSVEPASVVGDRRQLVSAISNLLDNAVKYSDGAGRVEVRSRVNGRWVEVEVQDHGIGIPRPDLTRIFERFYRVDRARSRDTGGTGLGLAIVRHIAGNHHGEVLVDSEEGEGSTFTLRLPAAAAPAEAG